MNSSLCRERTGRPLMQRVKTTGVDSARRGLEDLWHVCERDGGSLFWDQIKNTEVSVAEIYCHFVD